VKKKLMIAYLTEIEMKKYNNFQWYFLFKTIIKL